MTKVAEPFPPKKKSGKLVIFMLMHVCKIF